jgi:WD40 repeat protein
MKHPFYLLITIQLLITATSCYTMENKSNILAEITGLDNPVQTIFLSNNRIAINAINKCSIFDLSTQQEIPISTKDFSAYDPISWPYLAVHPNKQKLAFAHDQTIKIYNTKTGAEKFSFSTNDPSKTVASLIFSPSDDTIFVCYKNSCIIEHYNYKDNTLHDSIPAHGKSYAPIVRFNPTKERLCIAPNPGTISIRSLDKHLTEIFPTARDYHSCCEYSFDGSLIAFGNAHNITILDPYTFGYIEKNFKETVSSIAFHPKKQILALLLPTLLNTVHFYDAQTFNYITELLLLTPDKTKNLKYHDLSFSPDGEKMIIALADKCIILTVPFEVIHHCHTTENI